jgi:hypothetical protein
MPKYIVDLEADGFLNKDEMEEWCDEFIRDQLHGSAIYATITKIEEDND